MKQMAFASAVWQSKVTRRERFLAEMNATIPWEPIKSLIEPYYPKTGNGTQPMPLERMLRIYFMQRSHSVGVCCCPRCSHRVPNS